MSRLPRFPADAKATGKDLNLILAVLDTGGNMDRTSATNSGVTGDSLSPTIPNIAGSISPGPGAPGAPVTPRGFTGTYGIDNFAQSHTAYALLSWTPNPVSDFVSKYDIYYHKGSDPTLYNLSVSGDVNSIRVNNLFPGNSYSFAIQAHDAANRISQWSPEMVINISLDSDPPAIPTNLTAFGTAGGVYLTWTEVGDEGISNDLKQYQIAISQDGTTYPSSRTVGPGNSYFYTPDFPNPGTIYFKIASRDWTGNLSDYSTPVTGTVGTILGPFTIGAGFLALETSGNYLLEDGSGYYLVNSGDLIITAGNIIFGLTSANKIIPGATTLLMRDSTDTFTNLGITNAGVVTIRAGLILTAGDFSFGGTSAKIIAGATSLLIRDHLDANTNLSISDAGVVAIRSDLGVTGVIGSNVGGVAAVWDAAVAGGTHQWKSNNTTTLMTLSVASLLNLSQAAVIAAGGGAAPTFTTIGGLGPATAAQNGWVKIQIAGTDTFFPAWR